jgi:hypothetical protein
MKKNKIRNPLRSIMHVAILALILSIFGLIHSEKLSLWVGILYSVEATLFLYLYFKQSKYAWYALFVFCFFNSPGFILLRILGYNLGLKYSKPWWVSVGVWVLVLVYLIHVRGRYMSFIDDHKKPPSSDEQQTDLTSS